MSSKKTLTICCAVDLDGWFTPNTYAEKYGPLPDGPGVYMLVEPKEIRRGRNLSRIRIIYKIHYIGSSSNIKKRICGHQVLRDLENRDKYIRVYFHETEDFLKHEKDLIGTINPPLNKQLRTGGGI
jgi:hypothetical protein